MVRGLEDVFEECCLATSLYLCVSVRGHDSNFTALLFIPYQETREQGNGHLPGLGLFFRRSRDIISDRVFSRIDDHCEGGSPFMVEYAQDEREKKRKRRKIN